MGPAPVDALTFTNLSAPIQEHDDNQKLSDLPEKKDSLVLKVRKDLRVRRAKKVKREQLKQKHVFSLKLNNSDPI